MKLFIEAFKDFVGAFFTFEKISWNPTLEKEYNNLTNYQNLFMALSVTYILFVLFSIELKILDLQSTVLFCMVVIAQIVMNVTDKKVRGILTKESARVLQSQKLRVKLDETKA